MSDRELTPEELRDLETARELARAGIPIFFARPDPKGLTQSGKQTGFMLPSGWQKTRPNVHAVDQWEPGMALCAVGGVAGDWVDVDPRNDGDLAARQLIAEGKFPDSYGRAVTPSGGTHDLIAPLHIGKDKRAGIDYQGGNDNAQSRGFVFIAPTVRPSKITGELKPYRWEIEPDIPALKTKGLTDKSGAEFAKWIVVDEEKAKAEKGTRPNKHTGPIKDGEGHDDMVSYVGWLLRKFPEIELDDYVARSRARWEDYEQPPQYYWSWEECLANPVMDCWHNFTRGEVRDAEQPEADGDRWVNLDAYLDGTHEPPQPDLGARRDDDCQFLYPGRWHTLVGLTTAGKTFWALWQARAVMESGGHVMYIHFEEASPAGTLSRLIGMGVDKEVLRKQFHWGHTHQQWTKGEMAREVAKLSDRPALAVLDGINAACGIHDWPVGDNIAVGAYERLFVKPLTALGIAVLSLGHPVKNPQRQGEAYSYGAAGWLNNPDGCALRMETVKEWPIGKGQEGGSELYVVKDRYAVVQEHGVLDAEKGNMPWYYMGRFIVDDTVSPQGMRVSNPARPEESGNARDKYDAKADRVHEFLQGQKKGPGFDTVSKLLDALKEAKKWTGTKTELDPTLRRLVRRGCLEWPELPMDAKRGTARPGHLICKHPEAGTE